MTKSRNHFAPLQNNLRGNVASGSNRGMKTEDLSDPKQTQ